MRARHTRRPLCEREIRAGLGGKGKRVKQNQTDMMQLRRGCFQSVKVRRSSGCLAARMRFRHPHVPTLSRHLLTTLPLGRRHRCIGRHTCHHRQPGEQYRQSENSDFLHEVQRHECRRNSELDATGSEKIQITAVTRSPTQHSLWVPYPRPEHQTPLLPISFNHFTAPCPLSGANTTNHNRNTFQFGLFSHLHSLFRSQPRTLRGQLHRGRSGCFARPFKTRGSKD